MNGQVTGTPIQDLQHAAANYYDGNQQLIHEQGHNESHRLHQAQHSKYCDISSQYQPLPGETENNDDEILNEIEMSELAQELSDDVPEIVENIEEDDENVNGNGFDIISDNVKEPLLVIVIYMVMSHPAFRNFMTNNIRQLQPDAYGNISWGGIFIYGVVLALLFSISKRFLF